MHKQRNMISIIIINYKMADYIATCLESLKSQLNALHDEYRIIIVDNNSQDHIQEVIDASGIAHITTIFLDKNKGYGAGVNAGIRACTSDYYFIVNPDIIFFEPNTLHRLKAFMDENAHIGMAVPKLIHVNGALQYSCWRFPSTFVPLYRRTALGKMKHGKKALNHFQMRDWDHQQTLPIDCAMGSAMFVRHSAIEKAGLMDERYFMYFEDIDWCRTFWKHNQIIYYIHNIRLRHVLRRSSAKVSGLKSLVLNPLTRIHVLSWMKYLYKWRAEKV